MLLVSNSSMRGNDRFLTPPLPSVAIAVCLLSTKVLACECAPPPPPCQAIGQSQLVFLGTVTEIEAQSRPFKTARMTIDRAFKGDLNKTIELFDTGMCDGPDLQLGRQYLMYTSGSPNRGVPARGCTRSRRVEDADEDLEFLKAYSAGRVTTHIDGTVQFRPDEPEDSQEARTPMKDVKVILSGRGEQFHATTTSAGRYSFSKLPPGEYTVNADLPGYRLNWAPDTLTLVANGCVEANMLLMTDRTVQGTVRDDSGAPASGALVEIVSADRGQEVPTVRVDVSDEEGHYTIDEIPPGDYYLGVNIKSVPVKEHPYPSIYYPNTPDIRRASRISVGVGAGAQNFDLQVSRRLSLVTMRGRIQNADGAPPSVQDHPEVRIREPGLSGQVETKEIEIDTEGRFQYELCEGIKYSAFAFSGPVRARTYSAPVEFTPTRENDQLVLTIDKTPEEFHKLTRQP